MNDTPGGPAEQGSAGGARQQGIAAAIAEVSERASVLIREEIELAKTEIAEKTTRLAKGAVVAIVAGVFLLTALFFVLIGCAWLLYYELPGNDFTYFWGFFAMALILVVLGVIAGLLAARAVKSGSPPVPAMAIEEARKIRETVELIRRWADERRCARHARSTDGPRYAGDGRHEVRQRSRKGDARWHNARWLRYAARSSRTARSSPCRWIICTEK